MGVRAGKKWGRVETVQAIFSRQCFYVSGKPQIIRDFTVSLPSQSLSTYENLLEIVHITNSLGWLGTNYWEFRECFFLSNTSQNLGMISNHSWYLKIWISIVGDIAGNQVQSLDLSFLPVSFSLSIKKNKMASWTDSGIFLTYWRNLPVSQKTVTLPILQDFPDIENQA